MKNRYADLHRRAQERKRHQESNNSGGGGGGNYPKPQVGSQRFYAPDGSFYLKKAERGTPRYGVLYNPFSEEAGAEPVLSSISTHRIRAARDASVLPRRFQKNPQYNQFQCTLDHDAGPKDLGHFQPSAGWAITDDEAAYCLSMHGLSIYLCFDGEEILIPEPEWWPSYEVPHETAVRYADFEEAQFHAERVLARGLSCVLCLVAKDEHLRYAEVDWKERGEKVDVKFAQGSFLVPLVILDWMVFSAGKPDKPVSVVFPEATHSILNPGNLSSAIRRGPTWLEISDNPRAATHAGWDQYIEYTAKVQGICGGCLDNGRRTGAHNHKLAVTSIVCRSCSEVWESERESEDGATLRVAWDQTACIQMYPDAKDHLEVVLEGGQCHHCGSEELPKRVWECSTAACTAPTPLRLDEVITKLAMVTAAGSSGAYWTFEVWTPTSGPEVGRIQWGKALLGSLPAVHPADAVVIDTAATVGEMLDTLPPMEGYDGYIKLSPARQAQMVGTDLVTFEGGSRR